MPDVLADNWIEHAQDRLTQAGFRRGGARRAVIELLGAQTCALTAQEIDERLRTKGRAVGRIAEKLPDAPEWATFVSAGDPDDPSGSVGAHLYYARPLGGGDSGAPPVCTTAGPPTQSTRCPSAFTSRIRSAT